MVKYDSISGSSKIVVFNCVKLSKPYKNTNISNNFICS